MMTKAMIPHPGLASRSFGGCSHYDRRSATVASKEDGAKTVIGKRVVNPSTHLRPKGPHHAFVTALPGSIVLWCLLVAALQAPHRPVHDSGGLACDYWRKRWWRRWCWWQQREVVIWVSGRARWRLGCLRGACGVTSP
mmetsp:Transcript_43368/g.73779  ORF Transcript_43368/g.73779 Transcript_43368/m.73779 type:complete len:138 (+) Transcript_43368:579-992(+)